MTQTHNLPNLPAAVDAPIARQFHAMRFWWRATEQGFSGP